MTKISERLTKHSQNINSGTGVTQWWGVLGGILIVLGLYIFPEIIVLPLTFAFFALNTGSFVYSEYMVWLSSTWGNFWFTLLTDLLILTVVAIIAVKKKTTLVALGLRKPKLIHLLQSAMIFAAYISLYLMISFGVSALVPGFNLEQERDIGFNDLAGMSEMITVFVLLVIITPFVEEILFRGFLYGGFRRKLLMWPAALVTSLLFGAAHLGSLSGSSPVWVAALDTFVLSMVLCVMREKLKSLWPMIYVHGLKNALAFAFIYLIH